MSKLSRKFARNKPLIPVINKPPQNHGFWMTEAEYRRTSKEIAMNLAEETTVKVLAASVYVLQNNFGALQKKDTRIKNFYKLYREYLEKIDKPDAKMLEAEKALKEQTGCGILRSGKNGSL